MDLLRDLPLTISSMFSKKIFLFATLAFATIFWNCNATKKSGGGFNLFAVQDDIKLGQEFSKQIDSDQANYPLLQEQGNEEV